MKPFHWLLSRISASFSLSSSASSYTSHFQMLRKQKSNLFLDMPIRGRLTLGFLMAALIATLIASIIGIQRIESLNRQSDFYRHLLHTNTSLTTDTNFLQTAYIENQVILDILNETTPSKETLNQSISAVQDLSKRYNTILSTYMNQDLLANHSDMIALVAEAGHGGLIVQQRILADSTLRSWQVYRVAQEQFLQYAIPGHIVKAQRVEQLQIQPTYTDLMSSLRALIQFNQGLTDSVQDASQAETQKLFVTTVAGAAAAFLLITLVGWLISNTLIQRLHQLRQVTQDVEKGNLDARVLIIGRDEIAAVSASVNTMLETIVADRKIVLEYEQQRQLNQMKDQFIVNVSHELRTPLTQVYGYLELLSEYHQQLDPEILTKFFNNAKYGCNELMLLVNNVLDTTHASSHLKAPRLEKVSVVHIVQEVTEHLAPREGQEHTLHVEIQENLNVWADQQYLRQVLRNLLSNAFKYAPQHTSIFINATADIIKDAKGEVCISVRDEGAGIPVDEQPLLFQKFMRLQRDLSGPVRGTGLGLYICKQLVEAMHGRIWVESSGIKGKGSCFSFTLPTVVASPTTQRVIDPVIVTPLDALPQI